MLRGEARRLPPAHRRVLRDRALPRLLLEPPSPCRRARARVGGLTRLRSAAGRDGPVDLPRGRARTLHRAPARPRRPVGPRASLNTKQRHVAEDVSGAAAAAQVSATELITTWKQRFPDFWPDGNRFYAPLTGIEPRA